MGRNPSGRRGHGCARIGDPSRTRAGRRSRRTGATFAPKIRAAWSPGCSKRPILREDVILVDQRYPFGFYWPRWNYSADGFPPAEPAGLAPAQYLFVDINTVAERLASFARGRERVFLVRWFESDTNHTRATAWVLEKFGAQLGERSFRGYQVLWYEVSSTASFELAPGLDGPGRRVWRSGADGHVQRLADTGPVTQAPSSRRVHPWLRPTNRSGWWHAGLGWPAQSSRAKRCRAA